jgi:outer membrane immunogenic protein
MNRFTVTLLAATALSIGAAAASDLPARSYTKAVPYAPVYNWTGFYVGGHIGGAWSNTSISDPTGANFAPAGASIGDNGSGFLGGAQIGYNWQTGNLVFGIQGDGSWTSINASSTDPFIAGLTFNDKVNWLGTATGRIGYAWNNVLLYGKGGGAWVYNKYSASGGGGGGGGGATATSTQGGWTVGAGLEYGFTPNWTTFIEYDYIGLGTNTVTFTTGGGSVPASIKQDISMVKAGINYKFGGL